jgi:hypothetical protein
MPKKQRRWNSFCGYTKIVAYSSPKSFMGNENVQNGTLSISLEMIAGHILQE